MADVLQIRALTFDVFGTLVDWRTSIAREVRTLAPTVDAEAVADAWRAGYRPAMDEVRSGGRPWVNLDVLHREILDGIVDRFDLQGWDDCQRAHLTMAWHRLSAWQDVADGLRRLRKRYRIAPCSNGHIALMVDLARTNRFRWDTVLGAELVHDYKPTPTLYLSAVAAFDCAPHEVMMVASHSQDLEAAAALGLLTAHVARPDEAGPGLGERAPSVPVDLAVDSITDLADRLRC